MTHAARQGLVIVGASYAGLQLATSARDAGYAEPITLIGEEPDAPYHRPPLSKGYLKGTMGAAELPLRAPAFYEERRISLVTGERVTAIDRTAGAVQTASGRRFAFDRLALTTGARPRPAPGVDMTLGGVITVRTRADADRLRESAASARHVVVLGGGYVGLEVAAALAAAARDVTVVERAERLLARVASATVAEALAGRHRAAGVRLCLRNGLQQVTARDGRVDGVALSDGSQLPCDLLVVGIGAIANDELAAQAGLAVDDGVLVDPAGRTSDPRIVAVGDCARYDNPFAGGSVRIESVQNALDHAKVVGATLAGAAAFGPGVPWFWSDQYELKLQIAGLLPVAAARADSRRYQAVIRGDADALRFSVFHLWDGQVVAVESIGRPAEHMLARKLITARAAVPPALIADPQADLKAVLQPAPAPA